MVLYYLDICVEKLEQFRAHFGRLVKTLPRQYKETYKKSAQCVFKWEYELRAYQISSIYLLQFSQKRYIKSAQRRGAPTPLNVDETLQVTQNMSESHGSLVHVDGVPLKFGEGFELGRNGRYGTI